MNVPEKWGIRLPMDSIEEVKAFNDKLKLVTTDEDGNMSYCKQELVHMNFIF